MMEILENDSCISLNVVQIIQSYIANGDLQSNTSYEIYC